MALPIPQEFINDLLNQCDIVALINHFISLKKQGNNYISCCPFHEENTASFTVSATKQIYHCFGCHVGGNAIRFVMAYEKLEFVAAVQWLAHHLQIPLPNTSSQSSVSTNRVKALYMALEDAAQFYQAQLSKTPDALAYLTKRGFTDTSIQQFKLGFASHHWDSLLKFLTQQKKHPISVLKDAGLVIQKDASHYYDRFRSRIIFPIRDKQGRCIGLGGRVLNSAHEPKYLNSPETTLFHKNQALYGLYESLVQRKDMRRFWVVEGYLDVMTLHQFGFSETVATLGTATSKTHLQQLFRLTEEIVFCFDGDLAGQKAAIRALELSLSVLQDNRSIRFLMLPKGDDPDSWMRKSSATERETIIQKTLLLEDFLFQSMQEGILINTMNGQRALLQKILPLFKRMPNSIRREQLMQRLARLVNIEVDKLQNLSSHERSFQKTRKAGEKKAYTVLDRAIGLLLQHPKILQPQLPTTLSERIQREYPLLNTLIHKVQEDSNTHTAGLLEKFSQHSFYEHLIALAQYDWLVPFEGVNAEFHDILAHLDKIIRDRTIKDLIEKARNHMITEKERDELTQLLSERES